MARIASVPGRTARCTSARRAMAVARGSITMTRAPLLRFAVLISGGRCVLDTDGFAPHTTTASLCATSVGSPSSMSPTIARIAAPEVAAQMVCGTEEAPSRSNSSGPIDEPAARPAEELYRYGTIPAGPWGPSRHSRRRSAMSDIASSQLTGRNDPLPFGPTRTIGVRTRSGPYTRSAWCLTFLQMNPCVNAFAAMPTGAASTRSRRPSSTSTWRLQESGQSRGQAVSSV